MLQFSQFYQQCYQDFYKVGLRPEDLCKKLFAEIDRKRREKAAKNLLFYVDQLIWTEASEHIDRLDIDSNLKKKIINGLNLKNNIFGTYNKLIKILSPYIEEINQQENRPAKIIEIGCGLGKLTQALYLKTKNSNLKFEITGSDIVPEYIEAAKMEVFDKKIPVNFKVIDAHGLDLLEDGSYDIVFCLHSLHHFTPEDLTKIMSGSQKMATKAFVAVDGYRGIANMLFMSMSGMLAAFFNMNISFFHDSVISARKMYTAKQLEIIAKMACPQSTIVAKNLLPGLTSIEIVNNERKK